MKGLKDIYIYYLQCTFTINDVSIKGCKDTFTISNIGFKRGCIYN